MTYHRLASVWNIRQLPSVMRLHEMAGDGVNSQGTLVNVSDCSATGSGRVNLNTNFLTSSPSTPSRMMKKLVARKQAFLMSNSDRTGRNETRNFNGAFVSLKS